MATKPLALEKAPPTQVIGINVEALLEKAIDAKSAVEVLERLQAMRREVRAEQSKEAFDRAMADFQSECPIIEKKKAGARNAYRFAPLDAIVLQVRELIRKHGFSFTMSSEVSEGWVKALCKVTHESGHSEVSEFKAPVDDKNPMMTNPQRYGGSMTFAKRYAFCNAFGILTADEDIDGQDKTKVQGPSSKQPGEKTLKELCTELWNVTKSIGGTERVWDMRNAWLLENGLLGDTEEFPHQITKERAVEIIAKAKELLK